ncbi:MAG: glycerol kinase GlpK [Halobacteriales archaeon]
MSTPIYVGAIDQGTTGTRFMAFDRDGEVAAEAYATHEQYYPKPGWVEHDPLEIWERTKTVVTDGLSEAGIQPEQLAAIGVTNQRETTLLWDGRTGEPLHNAIVWQDRRTTERIEGLEDAGRVEWIRDKTGLKPDAYFSATKAEWLLEHATDRADSAGAGSEDLMLGTIDSWLVYNLTGRHVIDVTNASRTMLFDIHAVEWDEELLDLFGVPESMLPEVRPSMDPAGFGTTNPEGFLGAEVPVAGVLGDQQAALVGHTGFDAGDAKNTYGTGSFLVMNTAEEPVKSQHGLLTTIAFQQAGEPVQYALEGSIFSTGAAIEWLEEIGLIDSPEETGSLAEEVNGTDGVFVVPAFTGLGAPHWDGRARGTIVGLSRGTEREHIARATLESIGFRTRDVIEAMEQDAGLETPELRVDGGAVSSDVLCQLQADLLQTSIRRPVVDETTALGAAYSAGLTVGYWGSVEDLRDNWQIDRTFEPTMPADRADDRYDRWADAVERSLDWARDGDE